MLIDLLNANMVHEGSNQSDFHLFPNMTEHLRQRCVISDHTFSANYHKQQSCTRVASELHFF